MHVAAFPIHCMHGDWQAIQVLAALVVGCSRIVYPGWQVRQFVALEHVAHEEGQA